MNVHGLEVPESAVDAGREFMRCGRIFNERMVADVIKRNFQPKPDHLSPEGHTSVCTSAAYALIQQAKRAGQLDHVRRVAGAMSTWTWKEGR